MSKLFSEVQPKVHFSEFGMPKFSWGAKLTVEGGFVVYGTAGARKFVAANSGGWGIAHPHPHADVDESCRLEITPDKNFSDPIAASEALSTVLTMDAYNLAAYKQLFEAMNVFGYFEQTGDVEAIQFLGDSAVKLLTARRAFEIADKACCGRTTRSGDPLFEARKFAFAHLRKIESQITQSQKAAERTEEEEILDFVRKMEAREINQ